MCNPKTTLTLKHPELIDTTCEQSLEFFEDDKSLKKILGFYEKPFTPPKKEWVTCAIFNTKEKEKEEESNESEKNNKEFNPEFLKKNALPLGETMDIPMDVNNEENVIKIGMFFDDEEQ